MAKQITKRHKDTALKWLHLRPVRAIFLCVPFLFVSMLGCASQSQLKSYQGDIVNLKRELQFIREQNARQRRELDELKKQLAEQESLTRQTKADLLAQIDELQQQVSITQNQIEELGAGGPPGTQPSQSASTGQPQTNVGSAEMDTTSGARPTLGLDESRELYNTAYGDLIRGNYQLALHGFRQFLELYPQSDLADNAQYWIGEIFYAQGRFPDAISEFEKVTRLFPNGDKVAPALLKIGYAYISLQEMEQGKLYLEEVIKDYPDSEEAQLAQGRLQTLK